MTVQPNVMHRRAILLETVFTRHLSRVTSAQLSNRAPEYVEIKCTFAVILLHTISCILLSIEQESKSKFQILLAKKHYYIPECEMAEEERTYPMQCLCCDCEHNSARIRHRCVSTVSY
jgi:hypothetical protein